jgi:hypothetical protein
MVAPFRPVRGSADLPPISRPRTHDEHEVLS